MLSYRLVTTSSFVRKTQDTSAFLLAEPPTFTFLRPSEIKPIGYLETSGVNYQPTLRKIPEEQIYQLKNGCNSFFF
jgi:hypothetical protein